MRTDILRVFETPQFGAAGTDARYPRTIAEIANVQVQYALDGSDTLTFSVPASDDMIDLLTARKVVRLAIPDEGESEWLISRTSQAIGPAGQGVLRVECDPIRVVMSDAGIVEKVVTGNTSYTNLGGINGSIENYLATFVIPHLTRRGYSWIEIGDIDSAQQFDYSFEAQTATTVIEELVKQVGHEWQLRRDEPNSRYLIDIVERIGEVITDIQAREGSNILELVSQRNREQLFTSIRPIGNTRPDRQEPANLGLAAWRVTDVTGDDVSVEPHFGGIGAIIEDGQHVGLYLQAVLGTYHLIEGSVEATQTFELPTGAGALFAVGDSVTIVADSSGTWLSSVESASGVAQFGFVQGKIASNHFVERQYLRNPNLDLPSASAAIASGRVDGNYTDATVIDFKDLPPNFDFGDGVYVVWANLGVRISTGAVGATSGTGTITITVTDAWTIPNNASVAIIQRQTSTTDFTPLRYTAADGNFVGHKWTPAAEINETANVDGAVSNIARVSVKNLPPNFVVYAGTNISGGNFRNAYVLRDTTTDGSGNVTLDISTVANQANNDPVTLRRPDWRTNPGTHDGVVLGTTWSRGDVALPGWQMQQDVWVHDNAELSVFCAATFSAWTHDTVNFWDTTRGPRIVLRRAQDNELVANGAREPLTFIAPHTAYTTRATLFTGVSSGPYRWVIEGPRQIEETVGSPSFDRNGPFSWAYVLNRVTLHVSDSVGGTILEGSTATNIFQDAQLALLASRQWPATYTARLSEIVSEWGLPSNSPALALGAIIRLRAPSMKVDLLLRIVGIEFDPTNPAERTFIFDTDPSRLSKLAAQSRLPAAFVDIDTAVSAGRVRQSAIVRTAPPVRIPGAERFVVTGTATGAQPVNPLP